MTVKEGPRASRVRGGRLYFTEVGGGGERGGGKEGSRRGRRGWCLDRDWVGEGLPPGLLGRRN